MPNIPGWRPSQKLYNEKIVTERYPKQQSAEDKAIGDSEEYSKVQWELIGLGILLLVFISIGVVFVLRG